MIWWARMDGKKYQLVTGYEKEYMATRAGAKLEELRPEIKLHKDIIALGNVVHVTANLDYSPPSEEKLQSLVNKIKKDAQGTFRIFVQNEAEEYEQWPQFFPKMSDANKIIKIYLRPHFRKCVVVQDTIKYEQNHVLEL